MSAVNEGSPTDANAWMQLADYDTREHEKDTDVRHQGRGRGGKKAYSLPTVGAQQFSAPSLSFEANLHGEQNGPSRLSSSLPSSWHSIWMCSSECVLTDDHGCLSFEQWHDGVANHTDDAAKDEEVQVNPGHLALHARDCGCRIPSG